MAMTQKDWDDLELAISTEIETQLKALGPYKNVSEIEAYAAKQAALHISNLQDSNPETPPPDPPPFEPPFTVTVGIGKVSLGMSASLTDAECAGLSIEVNPD